MLIHNFGCTASKMSLRSLLVAGFLIILLNVIMVQMMSKRSLNWTCLKKLKQVLFFGCLGETFWYFIVYCKILCKETLISLFCVYYHFLAFKKYNFEI